MSELTLTGQAVSPEASPPGKGLMGAGGGLGLPLTLPPGGADFLYWEACRGSNLEDS